MDDLIVRVNKYALGAGRTQEGQYRGAKRDEGLSNWIGWTSAALRRPHKTCHVTSCLGASSWSPVIRSRRKPMKLSKLLLFSLTLLLTLPAAPQNSASCAALRRCSPLLATG